MCYTGVCPYEYGLFGDNCEALQYSGPLGIMPLDAYCNACPTKMKKLEPITVCPYCGGEVILTSNKELYGREYGKHPRCYLCKNCKASVGVHPNNRPLGILANAELKELKMKAHRLFDPYWKSKKMKRQEAYRKLASKLNIAYDNCHIGYFNKPMLLKVIKILETDGL